jgi:hypothetical protein
MQGLDNLLSVCYSFKQGQFGVEEFQSRIFTAAIPDDIAKQFAKQLINFDNMLEEIIYCNAPSSRKESAEKIADDLIQATLVEQKRLFETGSYKNS